MSRERRDLVETLVTAIQASHLVLVAARAAGRTDVEAIVRRARDLLLAAEIAMDAPLDQLSPT